MTRPYLIILSHLGVCIRDIEIRKITKFLYVNDNLLNTCKQY